MRLEEGAGFVVEKRKEEVLHLASEENLAAALRTEVDRKNDLAAEALAILDILCVCVEIQPGWLKP